MTQQMNPPHVPVPPPHQPAGQFGPPPGAGFPPPPFGPPPGAGFGPAPARPRRTGVIIGAVVSAVLALGGLVVGALLLFGAQELDTAQAETEIARLTEEQVGLAATDVRCPADVPLEAGTTTTCTATLDGQPTTFTVQQTDGEGNVQITSDDVLVVLTDVEAELAIQVGDEAGVEAAAICDAEGRSVLVGTGTPIPCTVVNAGDATDSIDVVATVDEAGQVSYEVV